MPDKPFAFNEELLDKLRCFIQDHDPVRVGRSMRMVFFEALRAQTAGLHIEFDKMLDDMEAVIDLMEVFADETKDWRLK